MYAGRYTQVPNLVVLLHILGYQTWSFWSYSGTHPVTPKIVYQTHPKNVARFYFRVLIFGGLDGSVPRTALLRVLRVTCRVFNVYRARPDPDPHPKRTQEWLETRLRRFRIYCEFSELQTSIFPPMAKIRVSKNRPDMSVRTLC